MTDVAREAGVSTMTVSRVLSGYPGVRSDTRQRVELAIESLGYRVNIAARTLAGGRSRLIGVVAIEPPYFGPSNTLFGIEAAARDMEHVVNFVTIPHLDRFELRGSLDHLRSAHVDGVIVIAPVRGVVDVLTEIGASIPLVVMCGQNGSGFPTVAVDQQEGSHLAVRHLLALGHRTVHHVRGATNWTDADLREAGWRKALRVAGARAPRLLVGDWSPRSGYEAGLKLAADPAVTAVFVANDQMALGVLLALGEAGRRVPADVSIVGFDDTPESAFFSPPLTTIRQDFAELGHRGVDLLLNVMDGVPSATHITVPSELVVRRSTAAPSISSRSSR
jgi:DNA-binding LacI/PurR family transcriptional regulator